MHVLSVHGDYSIFYSTAQYAAFVVDAIIAGPILVLVITHWHGTQDDSVSQCNLMENGEILPLLSPKLPTDGHRFSVGDEVGTPTPVKNLITIR